MHSIFRGVDQRALTEEVVTQLLFRDEPACLPVNRHQSAWIYSLCSGTVRVRAGGVQAPHLNVATALRTEDETKRIDNPQHILARQNPELRHQAAASSSKLAKMAGLGPIQFSKIFTFKVEGHGFPYIAGELVQSARLGHNWQVQALSHVLLLASKNADLNDALQDLPLPHSTG
jgi:hypothetical protein